MSKATQFPPGWKPDSRLGYLFGPNARQRAKVWRPRLVKYSPDQARVPAGGPGGGQFGSEGGEGSTPAPKERALAEEWLAGNTGNVGSVADKILRGKKVADGKPGVADGKTLASLIMHGDTTPRLYRGLTMTESQEAQLNEHLHSGKPIHIAPASWSLYEPVAEHFAEERSEEQMFSRGAVRLVLEPGAKGFDMQPHLSSKSEQWTKDFFRENGVKAPDTGEWLTGGNFIVTAIKEPFAGTADSPVVTLKAAP